MSECLFDLIEIALAARGFFRRARTWEPVMKLTTKQQLEVWSHFIRRWAEIMVEELARDIEALDRTDSFNEVFLAAYWMEITERITNTLLPRTKALTLSDIRSEAELRDRWSIMCKHFPLAPSSELPVDVIKTLESMKQRVAKDYEQRVRRDIDHNLVKSPIEQLFLLQWHYLRADEICGVTLHPQEKIITNRGAWVIDFVVRSKSADEPRGTVAIELDGHEFHEKTKEQVAHDKRRERAIVRAGLPVLRFSGHEIWRDTRKCVQEVIDYFRP